LNFFLLVQMKYAVLLVAAVALFGAVCGQNWTLQEYRHPKHPCVWTIEMDAKSLLRHNVYKLWVNSWFVRFSVENDNGDMMHNEIYRPDIVSKDTLNASYVRHFTYDSYSCEYEQDVLVDIYKEHFLEYIKSFTIFEDSRMALTFIPEGQNFTNKSTGRINEDDDDEYTVYFNNYTGLPDRDSFSLFVDKDNYVKAIVVDNDKPGERVVVKFKYGYEAELSEFAFKEEYIQNCTDNNIMKTPKPHSEVCAASTLNALLAVVFAFLAFFALF